MIFGLVFLSISMISVLVQPPPSTGRSCLSSLHAPCRSFTREQQPPRDDGDDRLRCVMLSLDADHRGRNSMICSWTASAAANHG
uniref:Secreted protein n=1 Tax=Oryza sativa subsp. japonica TaxID=39947 RepID=Q8H4K8_ORYSJ|nr:hypothetical protein [Oryza sativa Japonica Group]